VVFSLALALLAAPAARSHNFAAQYRMHCGGEDYIEAAGNCGEAEFHSNGEMATTILAPISNTESPDPFQSERWDNPNSGNLGYAFDVDPCEYPVRWSIKSALPGMGKPNPNAFSTNNK